MLVIKYGGNAMAADLTGDPLLEEAARLRRSGEAVVLVHGGGPEIDAALAERGIETSRRDGQRVTDAATLAVTEAVLCGTLNKRIVRAFAAMGIDAAGISGEDGRTLLAKRKLGTHGEDLGFVGEVYSVDVHLLHAILGAGFLPVVAPLALAYDSAHAYNVNADAAAGAIAGALRAKAFILVTNVPRVLRDPDDASSGIDRLTVEDGLAFAASDACRSSMKPKVLAAARAAGEGADASYICAARPNAIAAALAGDATIISS